MRGDAVTARPSARGGQVDRAALRTNQAFIIGFLALAFVLDQAWLVAFVCAVMAIGTGIPAAALFQRIYRDILRPAGLLKPDVHAEDPTPHRFAQGMGAAVLLLATLGLFFGATGLGWGLAFVVIALAAVNLFFGFCAGCFVYFQLQRVRR